MKRMFTLAGLICISIMGFGQKDTMTETTRDTSLLPSHEGTLVKCEFFKTAQHNLTGGETHPIGTEGSFALLIIVSGHSADIEKFATLQA